MRKANGTISKTMTFGAFYLVLNVALLAANYFGFEAFQPSAELEAILGGLAAVLVMVLRKVTKEPMA